MNFPDFPPEMVATKLELATNYLTVLNTIEPGLSKFRAKFMYEVIDTRIYIFSRRFQETGEANVKELQGMEKTIKNNQTRSREGQAQTLKWNYGLNFLIN